MNKIMLGLCGGLALAAIATTGAIAQSPPLYPQIVDASHATPQANEFFRSFFTAKSEHKPGETMKHFSETQLTYIDATLGWPFYDFKSLGEVFENFMPKWAATGKSYPTRIIGDTNSAVIAFTDTPELFGGEIRILSAINFKDGKVVRWIDYWDGRNFGTEAVNKMRTPADKFPTEFSQKTVPENASAKMQDVAKKLNAAIAAGNAPAATALFSSDAVYEDMTLRSEIQGRLAIGRFLARAIGKLPYGTGASVTHVLGTDQGGGYEWNAAPPFAANVKRGITAILLDNNGQITRITSVWDGSMIGDSDLQALMLLAMDK